MSTFSRPSSMPTWREGDPIVLREIFRGRLWTARPATVAAVREDLIAVFLAPGTIFRVPAETTRDGILERLDRGWHLRDYEWTRGRTLHLMRPGVAHAIHLWWPPPDWRFGGWYINLQEPIRPTPLGFDFMDHVLDVVISLTCRGAGRTRRSSPRQWGLACSRLRMRMRSAPRASA